MGNQIDPQSLAQEIIKIIQNLNILDRNRYVRGAAGELEQIEDSGVGGNAGKPSSPPGLCYRARFTLRFLDYDEIGLLEKFLGEHIKKFKKTKEFEGEYNFGMHPFASQDPKIKLISIDEPNGKPSEQREALIKDLRTLASLLNNYSLQR